MPATGSFSSLAWLALGTHKFTVTRDEKAARRCFQRAAAKPSTGEGHRAPLALAALAFCHEFAIALPKADYRTAEMLYMEAAAAGCGLAQARLAFLKTHGRPNITIDHAIADVHRKACAKQGEHAVAWLRSAANAGVPAAQFCIGLCYYNGIALAEDDAQAFKWCEKAAWAGHSGAQNVLGNLFIEGSGCAVNPAAGLKWYVKAAAQREAAAVYNIGTLYERGLAVPEDVRLAFDWYSQAASWGSFNAQNVLGIFYEQGVGVDQNAALAVEHYMAAAKNGHPHAQYNLGRCYHDGFGTARDDEQAVTWFTRAARQNHALSQLSLGVCWEFGIGTEKNWDEAARWYALAGRSGCEEAKRRMRVVVAVELLPAARVLLGLMKPGFKPAGAARDDEMDLDDGRPTKGTSNRTGIHSLPYELLEHILSFMDPANILAPQQMRKLLGIAADRSTLLPKSADDSLGGMSRCNSTSSVSSTSSFTTIVASESSSSLSSLDTDESTLKKHPTYPISSRREFLDCLEISEFELDCDCGKPNASEDGMELDFEDGEDDMDEDEIDDDATDVGDDEIAEADLTDEQDMSDIDEMEGVDGLEADASLFVAEGTDVPVSFVGNGDGEDDEVDLTTPTATSYPAAGNTTPQHTPLSFCSDSSASSPSSSSSSSPIPDHHPVQTEQERKMSRSPCQQIKHVIMALEK
ncbi:ERAD-associated protein [Borealophlyctis nickersoniae]|nr:ERAD-associated protein [Borealophlyctis nickersoniae]